MNADAALAAACQEWRQLATAEGEAIRSLDWSLVATCQAALAELQTRLTQLHHTAKTEWANLGHTSHSREAELKHTVANLVKLEQANLALLAGTRLALQHDLDALDQTRQNLKRIQRSYTTTQPAVWHSYS